MGETKSSHSVCSYKGFSFKVWDNLTLQVFYIGSLIAALLWSRSHSMSNRKGKKNLKNQFAVPSVTLSFHLILPPFLSDQLPLEHTLWNVKDSGARRRLLMCSMRKQICGHFFFFSFSPLHLVRNIPHGGVISTSPRAADTRHPDVLLPIGCGDE